MLAKGFWNKDAPQGLTLLRCVLYGQHSIVANGLRVAPSEVLGSHNRLHGERPRQTSAKLAPTALREHGAESFTDTIARPIQEGAESWSLNPAPVFPAHVLMVNKQRQENGIAISRY